MSRDYANKPKPRRNSSRGNKSTKQKPKSFPILALLFVIMCIGAFGYFLWSIKDSAGPEPKTAKIEQPKTKPRKQDALPPKPKEKWEYQDLLEKKEVEVDVPKPSTKPSRPYQMQCGSFRKQSQADALKAKIAFQGLEAIVSKVDIKSGTWYKVVIGPYPRKRKAEHDRHKLQRANINGCQIWFWEGK
ncbi:SPOR domain-containing protein [Shewanella sp. 202IG2-18]|uniref:SPOR domain-containing protein n=1 Tax=Parashewanella hymeniacidonis TaxID=2807618 RepID=UPI0019622802|nr:SPOR domain-containing protein [Parashewanella hymeniacidonis]MBM7073228.1 SPOR domain-containing protein [Parashewanella hymeniacidonis]